MRNTFLFTCLTCLAIGCNTSGQDNARKTPAGAANQWLKPIQIIPLPGVEGRIDHFALDAKSGRLFMAALGNNSVEVIDPAAGKVTDRIKDLPTPQGVGFAPESSRIAVANDKDGSCRLYD